jgi:FixJ family two-component response regulator
VLPDATGGGTISGRDDGPGRPREKVSRVEGPVISIVDDDASQRTATVRLLRAVGFAAHAFASAQEFLLSPLLNGTSCLIADVEMPGMSGVKLQEQLIADGNTTPMIFITAFPEDRIREQAMKAGAIGFLTKPFDESRLLECVEQALKQRRDVSDQA